MQLPFGQPEFVFGCVSLGEVGVVSFGVFVVLVLLLPAPLNPFVSFESPNMSSRGSRGVVSISAGSVPLRFLGGLLRFFLLVAGGLRGVIGTLGGIPTTGNSD